MEREIKYNLAKENRPMKKLHLINKGKQNNKKNSR